MNSKSECHKVKDRAGILYYRGIKMNVGKVNKTIKVEGSEIVEKENNRFYFNWAGKSNFFKQK